jgi:hypothetical protein
MSTADGVGLRAVDIREKDHHDDAAVEVYGVTGEAIGPGGHMVRGEMRVSGPGAGESGGQRVIVNLGCLIGLFGVAQCVGIWQQG